LRYRRRLKRNGILRSDWSRGLVVAAVDGIEICSSFARCCDACMQREVQHKVRGEMRTDIQYYHRIVAVVIVGTPVPVPLGIRFQKDGEAEVPCASPCCRIWSATWGAAFLDLLVGDALYLQAPFVKEVERLGLDWAFTLKENQPDLLREAERFTAGRRLPSSPILSRSFAVGTCHKSIGRSPIAWCGWSKRFASSTNARSRSARMATISPKARSTWRWRSTNYYATNFELGAIPPTFIQQLSRSRWRIDAEVFQTITTDCHLKHPAVHQSTALVVLTMIRVLAYALSMVFYCRQVCSHARGSCDGFHEFAKRLAYGFVALSPNTS